MAIISRSSISAVTSRQHDPREPSRSGESTAALNDQTPASHWRHSPGIGISLSGRHADLSISTGVSSPLSGFVAGVSAPLSRYRLVYLPFLRGKGSSLLFLLFLETPPFSLLGPGLVRCSLYLAHLYSSSRHGHSRSGEDPGCQADREPPLAVPVGLPDL